jgi:corrinoid protein of di/trimethylamine methyltransferase
MPDPQAQLLADLSDAVVEMDADKAAVNAHRVVDERLDAYVAIDRGLAHGMERAGRLFEDEEYFIPELLLCSDAMYAGLDILRPHVRIDAGGKKGKIVIGVVEGDTHDIGKNLVKMMLETSGFDVIDLGRDVPPQRFVERAAETEADIIAISTLMTTTMEGMAEVIRLLEREHVRERFSVIVGGGPISAAFARKIGADGYAGNAASAAKLATSLLDSRRQLA